MKRDLQIDDDLGGARALVYGVLFGIVAWIVLLGLGWLAWRVFVR